MTGMTDIKIHRHPLKSVVIITFCHVHRDIYGDTSSIPELEGSYQKECIIQKNPNLDYINNAIGELLNDGDTLPWIMIVTLTGLPRTLRQGDYATIDDVVYKVSGVKPCNRNNSDVIQCFLHPERGDFEIDQDIPSVNEFDSLL